MELERLSSLVGYIFDAPVAPSGWDKLATAIAGQFAVPNCTIQVRDLSTGSAHLIGGTEAITPAFIEDYEAWHYQKDLWVTAAMRDHVGKIVHGHDLASDDDVRASEFFREFCEPLGLFHYIGGVEDIGDNCVGALSLFRSAEAGPFSAEDQRFLGYVLPHLRSALHLTTHLQTISHGHAVTLAALEQLSVGVIIVGLNGVVRFRNRTVEKIMRTDAGIAIRKGRLRLDNPQSEQALQKALEAAQRGATSRQFRPDCMVAVQGKAERPLSLLVSPLPSGAVGIRATGPVAAIFINDPEERRRPREETIAKLYGLTPAEGRLAKSLLEGERLQDYADRNDVSVHTVKTQLKQIFSKTGHARQTDLVRDIMANPVLRMRS